MVRRTARILAQGLALVVVLFLAMLGTDFRTTPIDRPPPSGTPARAALGAFLGSDAGGVAAIDDFAALLIEELKERHFLPIGAGDRNT